MLTNPENIGHSEPVISIRNLKMWYGSKQALRGINIDIHKGQIVGYIGPNGAGKSTTLKIVIGLLSDFEGDVQVLGFDVKKEPLEVKKRIGYVPENASLYEQLTPMEYLTFVGRLYKMEDDVVSKAATELLALFDLTDSKDKRMHTFSKGMRQKVLLISGLIHNPDIIVLDEPLSGLDANAVILVKEILSKLKGYGKTIFYSSHLMDVVEKISDRIVVLNNGEIVADGTFEELNQEAEASDSLEGIFNHLTGNIEQTVSKADDFIKAIGV